MPLGKHCYLEEPKNGAHVFQSCSWMVYDPILASQNPFSSWILPLLVNWMYLILVDPLPCSVLHTIYFGYFLQYFFILGKSLQLAENGSTSLFQITERRKPGPNCTSPPRRSFWRGTSSGPGQYQVSRVRCYEHNMMLWAQYDFLHVVINKVLQLPRSRKTLHESSFIESQILHTNEFFAKPQEKLAKMNSKVTNRDVCCKLPSIICCTELHGCD